MNFGSDDFTIFFRGVSIINPASTNPAFVNARFTSNTSTTIWDLASGNVSHSFNVRLGGVTYGLHSPVGAPSGEMHTMVFGRKGGGEAGNRLASNYRLFVDGTQAALNPTNGDFPSANFDSTLPTHVCYRNGQVYPGLIARYGIVKGRFLEPDEITGLEYDIIPDDMQPIYLFSGSVTDESSLGVPLTMINYTAADLDPATSSVWFRGATSVLLPAYKTVAGRLVEFGYTITRAIAILGSRTFTYTVRDQSNNAITSGLLVLDSTGRADVSFTIAPGNYIEVSADSSASAHNVISFL